MGFFINIAVPQSAEAQNRPSGNVPPPRPTYSDGSQPSDSSRPNYADASASGSNEDLFQGVEAGVRWPAVLGLKGQNFNPGLGFHAGFELYRFLDENVRHSITVGYQNLNLKADPNSSFRIVPIVFFTGIEGKSPIGITTTFDLGVGGAAGWINVPNAVAFQVRGYFVGVIQPGFELNLTDGFDFFVRTPITYLIASRSMGYLSYDAGLKIHF